MQYIIACLVSLGSYQHLSCYLVILNFNGATFEITWIKLLSYLLTFTTDEYNNKLVGQYKIELTSTKLRELPLIIASIYSN